VISLKEIALRDRVDRSALPLPCHQQHEVPRLLVECPLGGSRRLAVDVKVASKRQSVYCAEGRIFKRLHEVKVLAGLAASRA